MELPIALAASESLADRQQLVWSAFLDAAAAMRQRLWLPPPYRFVIGPHSATDLALAKVLQGAGRQVDALVLTDVTGPGGTVEVGPTSLSSAVL